MKQFAPGGDKSTILTTHSMEEVEALCTKVAIMKLGKFKCLGTIQHLKSKYGNGFSAEIQISQKTEKSKLEEIKKKIVQSVPGAKVETNRLNQITVDVESQVSISQLFTTLEQLQKDFPDDIQGYGIAQSSIEKVFIDIIGEK